MSTSAQLDDARRARLAERRALRDARERRERFLIYVASLTVMALVLALVVARCAG